MRDIVRLLCSAVAAVSIALYPAKAQEVTARARIDSTEYLVGDAITVHVSLSHPAGVTFQPTVGDSLGAFTVIGRAPFRQQGGTETATEFVVAKYDSGAGVIPAISFLYSLPGDTGSRTVSTNGLFASVRTVPVDTAAEIRDLKPPLSIPIPLWEIALYIGAVLLAGGLGYLLYRFWKRRRQSRGGEAFVPPSRPAHVIALEELGKLKDRHLWQQGLIKQYYSEVTEIFRRYIENRYRLMALEETTDEILDGLRKLRMSEDLLGRGSEILRRADLVKFAKHQPGVAEHNETLKYVYDFVDRTKITEMTPVSAVEAEGKPHVAA
jgi:hypothetical protein